MKVENGTDALVDGDVPFARGTARAALANRNFRIVWWGTFGSNVGTWMQNVVLAAFGYKLTRSAAYVSLLQFAQLGPLLFLATPAGVLADVLDKRKLLVVMQVQQLAFSFVLAWLARGGHPDETLLVLCVLVIGIGNALSGPALSAALPQLVPRPDLAGAVSLHSFQMNVSRVIGPAIGGVLFVFFGAAAVFGVNALTYLFAVAAIVAARFPETPRSEEQRGWRHLVSGIAYAWNDRLIRRIITTMATMSFFALPFLGLMPVIAAENLGMDVRSLAYGLLYAAFGTGAALGAMSIGTFLVRHSKARIVRIGFGVFALLLASFGLCRTPALAYVIVPALGFAYFATVTSMSTILQQHLEDRIRGRIMALWIMAFGGTVPLGTLAAGPVADLTSITAVVVAGAAAAAALVWYADFA